MTPGTPAMGTASPILPDDAARRLLASLHAHSRILVAISGGSDSTGLLMALHNALSQSTTPHSLVAATVDHALRPGSADEALAVSRLCASLWKRLPRRPATLQSRYLRVLLRADGGLGLPRHQAIELGFASCRIG